MDKEVKEAIVMFKDAKNDWIKLKDEMIDFAKQYTKELTEINTKLNDYKPKSFWRTGSFWAGIAPTIVAILLVLLVLALGKDCFYWGGEPNGICSELKAKSEENTKTAN